MSDTTAIRLVVSPLSATNLLLSVQFIYIASTKCISSCLPLVCLARWLDDANVIKLTCSLTYLPMAFGDVSDGEIGPQKLMIV